MMTEECEVQKVESDFKVEPRTPSPYVNMVDMVDVKDIKPKFEPYSFTQNYDNYSISSRPIYGSAYPIRTPSPPMKRMILKKSTSAMDRKNAAFIAILKEWSSLPKGWKNVDCYSMVAKHWEFKTRLPTVCVDYN